MPDNINVNVATVFEALFIKGIETYSKIPLEDKTEKKLTAISVDVARDTLLAKPRTSLQAIRSFRLNDLDNSFVERIINFSGNSAERAKRTFSLGENVRAHIQQKGIDFAFGKMLALSMMQLYLRAEAKISAFPDANLNSDQSRQAELVPFKDVGEILALKKDYRAFRQGVLGLDHQTGIAQCESIRDKDFVELCLEETGGQLNELNAISIIDERRSSQMRSVRDEIFSEANAAEGNVVADPNQASTAEDVAVKPSAKRQRLN